MISLLISLLIIKHGGLCLVVILPDRTQCQCYCGLAYDNLWLFRKGMADQKNHIYNLFVHLFACVIPFCHSRGERKLKRTDWIDHYVDRIWLAKAWIMTSSFSMNKSSTPTPWSKTKLTACIISGQGRPTSLTISNQINLPYFHI
jgi:hypothetical protein